MPELLEVEAYRTLIADRALDRPIADVVMPDAWYLKGGIGKVVLRRALVGRSFVSVRRIGKVALLDTSGGPTLALRFGMTGRPIVDGVAGIERLQYASARDHPAWDRFVILFDGGGRLVLRDPRRLGGVELDLDERRLGPDALTITPEAFRVALRGADAPLKARLLDQQRIAGLGNLLVDETLWRAGLHPGRPAGGLARQTQDRLHHHVRTTLDELMVRGGSHLGDLVRVVGGTCPRDGAPLARGTIGGRTTFWCTRHQRA